MSYTGLFLNDMWSVCPEFFRVFSLSALLTYGAIIGTTPALTESSSIQHSSNPSSLSVPVLGDIMNRLTARTMRRAARLIVNGFDMPSVTRFNGVRLSDAASNGAKRVLLLATAGCRLGSAHHTRQLGRYAYEYPLRMGLATLGLMIMVGANDRIARYLGLEWQSLCLYVMAAFRRGSAYSTEAGLKYFIMGAVASGFLLFGSSLVYGATGSVNFGDIAMRLTNTNTTDFGNTLNRRSTSDPLYLMSVIGMSMMVSAFFFKLAVAPFHAWAPDVYEGSPTPSTLYFAVVPKMAMMRVRTRLIYGPFADLFAASQSMRRLGAFRSRGVAALSARVQRRLKRFRAYSAIGHVGYMLLGLSSGSLEGVQASMIYRILYVVMSLNVWLVIMSLSRVSSMDMVDSRIQSAKYRTDLRGLGQSHPFLATTLSLSVRSMAGIPPLAGFMAKMWVFFAAVSQSLRVVSVFAVLSSCVGAFYYRRWIKVMYFEVSSTPTTRSPVDSMTSTIMGITTGRMLVVLAVPGPLRLLTHRMALAICMI